MVDTFYQISDKLPQYISLFQKKLSNFIRIENPISPSVIARLFLQCESKTKYDTLPVPFTCLNMATA